MSQTRALSQGLFPQLMQMRNARASDRLPGWPRRMSLSARMCLRRLSCNPVLKSCLTLTHTRTFARAIRISRMHAQNTHERTSTQALVSLPPRDSVCALEVGTSDGRGTTMALTKALDNYCRTQKRPWTLYGYEGLKKESAQAGSLWQMQRMGAVDATRGVHVINELVMTEENLKHWVLPLIDAIPGHGFPGKQFYEATYRNTRHLMREGKMGGFFSTIPPCARQAGRRMDLVSIDTTRHTNVGVLQTLLLHRAVDEHSVFVMESDYWNSAQRTVLTAAAFVARHVALRDVVEYPKTGHDWPWVTFRLNSSVPLKLQHK